MRRYFLLFVSKWRSGTTTALCSHVLLLLGPTKKWPHKKAIFMKTHYFVIRHSIVHTILAFSIKIMTFLKTFSSLFFQAFWHKTQACAFIASFIAELLQQLESLISCKFIVFTMPAHKKVFLSFYFCKCHLVANLSRNKRCS